MSRRTNIFIGSVALVLLVATEAARLHLRAERLQDANIRRWCEQAARDGGDVDVCIQRMKADGSYVIAIPRIVGDEKKGKG